MNKQETRTHHTNQYETNPDLPQSCIDDAILTPNFGATSKVFSELARYSTDASQVVSSSLNPN